MPQCRPVCPPQRHKFKRKSWWSNKTWVCECGALARQSGFVSWEISRLVPEAHGSTASDNPNHVTTWFAGPDF